MSELVLVDPVAEKYAAFFTSVGDEIQNEIETYTAAHHPKAHMLSGIVQGKFLEMLTRMINPRLVLEIGTFTGYSAISIAKGLDAGGMLHTIELRTEDATIAQSFFNKTSLRNVIQLHTGNALDIIPQLPYEWDFVFIDADKVGYISYYELVLPRLRAGGVILADNVLFHGQVLKETLQGKNAKAVHAFNEHIKNDNRVERVLLTVRDGLLLIRKK